MTQTAVLVFARAAGLSARAPGFAHPSVPPVVRVGVALALAGVVAPVVHELPPLDAVRFALAAAGEALLGAAIGFGASLLYDGAYFAGRTLDEYLGVRGSVPGANVTSAQAFGRLWSASFLAAFLLLDGWVPLVDAFAGSFAQIGPGVLPSDGAWLRFGLALPATMLRAALLVAMPAIAVAATLQLALAAVTRVVPRLAGFSLAFPAVFGAALAVTLVTLPLLLRTGARPWLVVPWVHAP